MSANTPFVVEVPVTASGLHVEVNRQIVGFHKSRRDLDASLVETSNAIIVDAFPIWGRRAPLSMNLVERSTKQLALNLRGPSRCGRRRFGVRRPTLDIGLRQSVFVVHWSAIRQEVELHDGGARLKVERTKRGSRFCKLYSSWKEYRPT
jgi:hypothetical protein